MTRTTQTLPMAATPSSTNGSSSSGNCNDERSLEILLLRVPVVLLLIPCCCFCCCSSCCCCCCCCCYCYCSSCCCWCWCWCCVRRWLLPTATTDPTIVCLSLLELLQALAAQVLRLVVLATLHSKIMSPTQTRSSFAPRRLSCLQLRLLYGILHSACILIFAHTTPPFLLQR